MKLDITEEMLFALLRSALHGTHADATIFAGITSEAWQECYRLSVRQGVMALDTGALRRHTRCSR